MTLIQDLKTFGRLLFGKEKLYGYRTMRLNRLFFSQCFLGLFLCSKEKTTGVSSKPWMIFINAISFVIIVGHLVLFAFYDELDGNVGRLIFAMIITVFYTLLIIPYVSYTYNTEMERIFHVFDQTHDFHLPIKTEEEPNFQSVEAGNLAKTAIYLGIIQCICSVTYALFTVLNVFIDYDSSKLEELDSYIIPTARRFVPNGQIYTFMTLSQIIGTSTVFMNGVLVPTFISFLVAEYSHRFEQMTLSLDWHTNRTLERIEKSSFQDRVKECKIFMKNFNSYIDRHGILSDAISDFEPFLLVHMSSIMVIFFVLEIEHILRVFVLPLPYFQKLRSLFMGIGGCTILFVDCFVGMTFEDMGERFSQSVYNIPWYYFEPKDRRIVHIFQSRTIKPIQFAALGLFPLNMEMFLRMWNLVYTYANTIRTFLRH